MRLTGARVFDLRRGFTERPLCVEGDRIVPDSFGEVCLAGCWLIPGLTDLHFHGCRGADVSDGDPAGLETIATYQLSRGVTQICPAVMTLSTPELLGACGAAAAHLAAGKPGAELAGIHLEGPFLSAAKCGAQNARWLRAPSLSLLDSLLEASQGLVKLMTVAPELDGAMDFIRAAKDLVTVSLGHTEADYGTALAAFQAGARQVTHLFNAMPPFHHRDPGVIGAAADCPEVFCELICDGVHVHPAAVRAAFRMLGAERILMVSDSMRGTGMPDGTYALGGQAVRVEKGCARLADGGLAGSVTDLMDCLKRAVSFGVPLADAVRAAAVNPAGVLGIAGRTGSLEPGKVANIAVLDENLELRAVLFHGKLVAGSLHGIGD